MKMIAKTMEGKEFFYNRNSAHAVSDAGAEEICRVLNEKKWRLNKPGESGTSMTWDGMSANTPRPGASHFIGGAA